MTNEHKSNTPSFPTILNNDARGRVLTPPAQREALLDAFEAQSKLSAPAFARERGINYQTFAGWRQRRAKQRKLEQVALSTVPQIDSLNLTEVVIATPESVCNSNTVNTSCNEGLPVEPLGNSRMVLRTPDQITLAAELIRALDNLSRRLA